MAKRITGTKEWAAYSRNVQLGCEHGCLYCYACAMAVRFKRCAPEGWTTPVLGKVPKKSGKLTGRIMFPTSHDITPTNIESCLKALEAYLVAGNEVLIVSKPHLECVDRMTKYLETYKGQVMFRFTIGTFVGADQKFWEPGAPGVNERTEALKLAHSRGFQTSVSMEPLLARDVDMVTEMVRILRPFVTDAIWIGRANKLALRVAFNCPGNEKAKAAAKELEATWTNEKVRELYLKLNTDPIVKWKDSCKEILGLPTQTKAGEDI